MLRVVGARSSSDSQYVMYFRFRFVDDAMFSHNGANGPESKTTQFRRPVR